MKELIQSPSRTSDQFTLRFPDGMREKCKDLAKNNRRSLNSELILAIEKHLKNAAQ